MPDLFEDFNKIFKRDLAPIFLKYLKDSNNNLPENINSFIEDPQTFLTDIFEKFYNNKDKNNQTNNSDIEKIIDMDAAFDDKYDDLFERLILIEENMIQIEKILKEQN